jgi:hypothetical protein
MDHNLEQILRRSLVAVSTVLVLGAYSVFGLYGCGGCGPRKWENVRCPNSGTKRDVMYDIDGDGELGQLEYDAYCSLAEPQAAEKGGPEEARARGESTEKNSYPQGTGDISRKRCKKPRTCSQNRGGDAALWPETYTPPPTSNDRVPYRSRLGSFGRRQ